VVYECVGGDIFTQCSKAMAWNGRLLIVGFASGQIPTFPVNLALVKGYSVVGVFWGSFTQHEPQIFAQNMKELFAWLVEGDVSVHVDQTYPLEHAVDALLTLNQRAVKGKLIITP
jgi:NADPH2:quinone reductase